MHFIVFVELTITSLKLRDFEKPKHQAGRCRVFGVDMPGQQEVDEMRKMRKRGGCTLDVGNQNTP